jgi:N-acetyl-gamma-glutamyl-phosphate reductase
VVQGAVTVAAATGSTGSGASASAGTHHPERFSNLKAYKVLQHQHVPEILAFLGGLGTAPELAFVPLSAPVDRGIFATCFVPVDAAVDAQAVLHDAYARHPMIRLRPVSPELRLVRGTNFADLSVHQQGGIAAVLCAIDNLGRGAAAQAVQALEIATGWSGPSPLRHAPLVP